MLTLLLIGMLTLAFKIQPVKAERTINIRADGSVDPPTAPISTMDNVTYTFTDNIYDSIVVQKDNIVVDGAGYVLQGAGEGNGISLWARSNVTIKNIEIKAFDNGIWLCGSPNNSISGNNITDNGDAIRLHDYSNDNSISRNNIENNLAGIWLLRSFCNSLHGNNIRVSEEYSIALLYCSNNTVFGNNVTNNNYGIFLYDSSNNSIYHNSLVNNTNQAYVYTSKSLSAWDHGYPSGGNFWSNYPGVDADDDGIGDTPYIINADNTDRFPLMAPFKTFDVGTWSGVTYKVDVVSNSTVSDFYFNPDEGAFLRFNVTGLSGTIGFSRVAIPKQLLWTENPWVVLVDHEPIIPTVTEDDNHVYLYFTYSHSTKTVTIVGTDAIPEFPSAIILSLFMAFTMIAVAFLKRRHLRKLKS